jgi:hypothetical protein
VKVWKAQQSRERLAWGEAYQSGGFLSPARTFDKAGQEMAGKAAGIAPRQRRMA